MFRPEGDCRTFAAKRLYRTAQGFYEAELVKRVLQKSCFLSQWLSFGQGMAIGYLTGSLMLGRYDAE